MSPSVEPGGLRSARYRAPKAESRGPDPLPNSVCKSSKDVRRGEAEDPCWEEPSQALSSKSPRGTSFLSALPVSARPKDLFLLVELREAELRMLRSAPSAGPESAGSRRWAGGEPLLGAAAAAAAASGSVPVTGRPDWGSLAGSLCAVAGPTTAAHGEGSGEARCRPHWALRKADALVAAAHHPRRSCWCLGRL